MPEQNGLIPLVIDDFSGGMTDQVLGGPVNAYERGDNLIINDNNDIESRPGRLSHFDERVDSSFMVSALHDHDEEILLQVGPKVKVNDSGITNIESPQTHNVFSSGDDNTNAFFSFWRKHTLAVSDEFTSVQKIYKNEDGDWRTTNLGMPDILHPFVIGLANSLKTTLNAHLADTSEHTNGADALNTITSPNAHNLDSLITLTTELVTDYTAHHADSQLASAWDFHAAQGTDYGLENSEAPINLYECYIKLQELKTKFNSHDADDTAHGTNSTHISSALTDIAISESGSGSNYIYGFHFTYRYFVENKQFTERGRVHLVEVEDINAPNATTVNISGIPVLSSGAIENWDDSNIKITIFRTTNNGSTLFRIGEISNGTTTFTDNFPDATIQNFETAYTEGGVIDNDLPPPAKFISMINDILVLAHVKDGSQVLGYRAVFSKPGEPSGVNEDSFVDFESDILGLGKVNIYPVFFLKEKCYRVEGSQNAAGTGTAIKRIISNRVGTVSPKSIISTDDGIFFAGEDGFYFTDGYKARLISTDLEDSFKRLFNKEKIKGCYDKKNNRVLFDVQTDSDSPANDTTWCFHLDFAKDDGGHPATTWSGGLDPENYSSSSIAYIAGTIYQGDSRGYLLKFDEDTNTDVFVDILKDPDEWAEQTIHWDYRSVAYDFGDQQVRKWVPKFNLNCDNETSLNLAISSNNDNSGLFDTLRAIGNNGVVLWGDRTVLWGSSLVWNYAPVISEWRYFPAGLTASIRCMYKQIKLSNNYVQVDSSESVGGATIDDSAKTVTLDAYPDVTWVEDAVNYYISFETDEYEQEFLITNLSSGVLTVVDGNDDLVSGSDVAWQIKGYKKNEKFKMLNYVLSYRPLTMSQKTFTGEVTA